MIKTKLEQAVSKLKTLGISKKAVAERAGIKYTDLINALRGESDYQVEQCYQAIINTFPNELNRERIKPETERELIEKLYKAVADLTEGQAEQTQLLKELLEKAGK